MRILGYIENTVPLSLESISIDKKSNNVLEMNSGSVKDFNMKNEIKGKIGKFLISGNKVIQNLNIYKLDENKFVKKIETEARQIFSKSIAAYEGLQIDLSEKELPPSLFD